MTCAPMRPPVALLPVFPLLVIVTQSAGLGGRTLAAAAASEASAKSSVLQLLCLGCRTSAAAAAAASASEAPAASFVSASGTRLICATKQK